VSIAIALYLILIFSVPGIFNIKRDPDCHFRNDLANLFYGVIVIGIDIAIYTSFFAGYFYKKITAGVLGRKHYVE